MSVFETYRDKKVLVTGTTGFLGKVLLEKMLYALDGIAKIYVLIRAKKGSKLNERFKKEILDSPCFDRLREKYGHDFDKYVEDKVHPIEGDLLKDGLGLSPANLQELSENVSIIINCAASIDFNARLEDAININIKGTFRMFELARKCQRLECFTHISTCYVNCNLRGRVREEIYPKDIDPDQELKDLLAYPSADLHKQTKEILGDYPNTYTFTKALCERLLQKHSGTMPLMVLRPAVINTSYREPMEGWVDSPAAASALYLYGGLGLIQEILGNPNHIGDNIPCDIVVDFIIVATAYHTKKTFLEVYNAGSSDRNPITWGQCQDEVNKFWNSNQSDLKMGKSKVWITPSQDAFNYNRLRRRLPAVFYNKVATFVGSKEHIKSSNKLLKSLEKGYQIEEMFRYFVSHEWIFESQKINALNDYLTPEEKKIFHIDVADIDIKRMAMIANYGLQKFILKENAEVPVPSNANLLEQKPKYFQDVRWAMSEGSFHMPGKTIDEYKKKVLKSQRVQEAIQSEVAARPIEGIEESTIRRKYEKEAEDIASEMFGDFKKPVIRFFAWTLHKVFRTIYEKVYIDEGFLERLRKIQTEVGVPIVLAPTQKSYLDFLIVSYIFFSYKLKLPAVASDEVLLKTTLIPYLLKSSGGFFLRKTEFKKNKLYRAILIEYIETLLMEGNNFEFFLEGTRSRTGKILSPQFDILNIIVDAVMEEKVSDVCIVPMTINYEKVLEGDTFPEELLGEEKVEESLLRVVKAIKLLKVNYGRVYIEFCEPIMLNKYVRDLVTPTFNPIKRKEQRKELVERLGYDIIYSLSEKVVIMSTSVVSAVLLMYRKGITEDLLISNVHWLSKQVLARGYRVGGINRNSPTVAVRNAIGHLENITVKTKKNIFELQISAEVDYNKLLMLSYYRNALTHVFLPEAFISLALVSFGSQMAYREGVALDRLMEETLFISKMLEKEYILQKEMKTEADFNRTFKTMLERKILFQRENNTVTVDIRSDKIIHFECSFLSPLLECYWATMQYMLSTKYDNRDKTFELGLAKFEEYVQWHIESLYEEKVIDHYEACSLETIKNATKTYASMGIITLREGRETKVEIVAAEEKLTDLENHLRKFTMNMKPVTSELLSKSTKFDLLNPKL